MREIINKIKISKGYVGIEVVLVAGLAIGIGVVLINHFRDTSIGMTEDSLNQMNNSIEDMHINTDFH